jgi:hypothetical protein
MSEKKRREEERREEKRSGAERMVTVFSFHETRINLLIY